jgi:hypothetical protein
MVAELEKTMNTANSFRNIARTPDKLFFPLLSDVISPTVDTEQGAFYLNRKAQTLRIWACKGKGPIRPKRINGRLHWSVNEIRLLVGS